MEKFYRIQLCFLVSVIVICGNGCSNSLENRYIEELKSSDDWPELARRLGDLRSIDAVAFFFGEMARAYPERIGLPARSEAEKRKFRQQEGDLFEGCVMSLITMRGRMGQQEFLQLIISILGDRRRPPEVRAVAANTFSEPEPDCPAEVVELVRSALLGCANDRDPLVRRNVAAALASIGAPTKK